MTDRRVRGVGTSRSSGKLTCKVRFSVYGTPSATQRANKQVRRVRSPSPRRRGRGARAAVRRRRRRRRRASRPRRAAPPRRPRPARRRAGRRRRALRRRPRRRRRASGRCRGCGGRRRRRGRRRSATDPLDQPQAAPATRSPTRAVTANGRPSSAPPSMASSAAASGSGRADTARLTSIPPRPTTAGATRPASAIGTQLWSGIWRSTWIRSKVTSSHHDASAGRAASRRASGTTSWARVTCGTYGCASGRSSGGLRHRLLRRRSSVSRSAPPTARWTVGVTGANEVGGPTSRVSGDASAAARRTVSRAATRSLSRRFVGETSVRCGATVRSFGGAERPAEAVELGRQRLRDEEDDADAMTHDQSPVRTCGRNRGPGPPSVTAHSQRGGGGRLASRPPRPRRRRRCPGPLASACSLACLARPSSIWSDSSATSDRIVTRFADTSTNPPWTATTISSFGLEVDADAVDVEGADERRVARQEGDVAAAERAERSPVSPRPSRGSAPG